MERFNYISPINLKEALSLCDRYGEQVSVLAGGTDLIPQIRARKRSPILVVDLKRIEEFTTVKCQSDSVYVGACVPCYQLYEDQKFSDHYPAVVDAISIIGGIQIQSRASLGGNLCNSSPSADSIPSMIVYNATAVIASINGERRVPVSEFCTAPGANVLERNEVLVGIEFPAESSKLGAAYARFTPRNEMDIAVTGVAVAVKLSDDGSTFESAQIALGGVAPKPLLAWEASAYLAGKPVNSESLAQAAKMAAQAASPIEDMRGTVEHRQQLVKVLTRRVAQKAIERCLTPQTQEQGG